MSRSKINWTCCERCSINIPTKIIEQHSNDCPIKELKYGFIKNGVLYGKLDIKIGGETGFDKNDVDSIVYLSESAMQLCSMSIGKWVLLKSLDINFRYSPVAKMVWPTVDKTLTSILMTQEGMETFLNQGAPVSVENFPNDLKPAKKIVTILLNEPRAFEITNELTNRLRQKYIDRPLTQSNNLNSLFYGKVLRFEIKIIEGNEDGDIADELGKLELKEHFYKPDEKTQWIIHRNEEEYSQAQKVSEELLMNIGGLQNEMCELRNLMQLCLQMQREPLFLGNNNSLLLYGTSGTGKTLLAEALAADSKAYVVTISPANLYSSGSGNFESFINNLFEDAFENQPSVMIIDSIDLLCPSWSSRLSDSDKRISATLLKNLDGLNKKTRKKVFVIATTNRPDAIDPAFRRCGILDRELEIPVPNPKARKDILLKLLKNTRHSLDDDSLNEIALESHGFVGADLMSLCSRAALNAGPRKDNILTLEDFKNAQKLVIPSAMREVQIEVPNVKWTDIGGQEDLKLILKQAVEWPLKYPESFIRLGVSPPRGVLMYGPPGCSKTMIAKALATESGLNFLSIKGPELFSKWVGESERAVREVFRKARQVSPSIIFFDEIDALGSERSTGSSSTSVQERVLAQLLTELDGVTPLGDVTIVAATNRPDRIDKALLRPGRLDRIVYVPLPSENTRCDIFRIKMSKMPVRDVDIDELVKLTASYSGAEINAVCHEAAMAALEENIEIKYIEKRHFEKALELVTPRTPTSLIELYENYQKIKI